MPDPILIPFVGDPDRCLWLIEGPRGTGLQLQNGQWFSDRFWSVDANDLNLLVHEVAYRVEWSNDEGDAVLRMQWEGELICEHESESKFIRGPIDIAAFTAAVNPTDD